MYVEFDMPNVGIASVEGAESSILSILEVLAPLSATRVFYHLVGSSGSGGISSFQVWPIDMGW